jgi:ATP-dependent DNA helicase RecG
MNEQSLKQILENGRTAAVEFKRCSESLEPNAYETVCAFLNRFGGEIFLGVDENGSLHGLSKEGAAELIHDFIGTISDPGIISPTVFLSPETVEYEGETILRINVPSSPEVHKYNNDIYDRINTSNVKVTAPGQIAQISKRKLKAFTERKVFPHVNDADLRMDLLPRVRQMAGDHVPDHEWKNMEDAELLRSVGLIDEDKETGKSGYTLAAVMLLGKDNLIRSVCPAYRTDALLRRTNSDRYDDRMIVQTNLIESYDRLLAFAEKHLPDKLFTEGDSRVSLRAEIAREMLVNTLVHREFTSPFYAKFVIEKDRMFVENANRAPSGESFTPDNLAPESKNPCIASFFRNIGLMDEPGSGVKRLFHYGTLYSGQNPVLIDGDVFRFILPLDEEHSHETGKSKTLSVDNGCTLNCTLGCSSTEKAIMKFIYENPAATQAELTVATGNTLRAVKLGMESLQQKGMIRRDRGKRSGIWVVIKDCHNIVFTK